MAFLVGRRPSGSPLCYDTNSEMCNSVRSSSSRQLKLPRCWMWENGTFVLVSSRTFKQESYVVSFSSLKRLRWLQAGVSCLDCLKYVSFLGLAIFFPCIQVILSDRKLVACKTTLVVATLWYGRSQWLGQWVGVTAIGMIFSVPRQTYEAFLHLTAFPRYRMEWNLCWWKPTQRLWVYARH